MFWRRLQIFGITLGFWLFGMGCGPSEKSSGTAVSDDATKSAGDVVQIYVVNYPLWYLTERIVGDRAEVVLPVPQGADPAFWHPTAEHVQAYQQADLILLWGADFAKWVKRVSLPDSRVVDTGARFREQWIYEEEALTHSHGDGEHSHGAIASTTWLDGDLLVRHAQSVHDVLAERYPQYAAVFGQNYRALEADLFDLDRRFQAAIPDSFSMAVFASHPVYQYLGRRHGLELINFHWEPGRMPEESAWDSFAIQLQEHPTRVMLWEDDPIGPIVERLRRLGVRPVVFHTVVGRPAEGDFLNLMQANADRLSQAFAGLAELP